jgi:hypothetical protein
MWLFTQYGFYSVVANTNNPEQLIVRARKVEHLVNLMERFRITADIDSTSGCDYAHRIFLKRRVWAHIVADLAYGIDYSNFKTEVSNRAASVGVDYLDRLFNVWSEMMLMQQSCPTCGSAHRKCCIGHCPDHWHDGYEPLQMGWLERK